MVARKVNPATANAAMVRRRFAELDKGKFGILDELLDSAYVPLSLAANKRFYETLYSAFPISATRSWSRSVRATRLPARQLCQGSWRRHSRRPACCIRAHPEDGGAGAGICAGS